MTSADAVLRDNGERSHGRAVVSASALTGFSLFVYFGSSFSYYINALPAGHLTNLVFLFVFSFLIIFRGGEIRLGADGLPVAFLLLAIAILSLVAWIARAAWDLAGLLVSVTWFLPLVLMIHLDNSPELRFGRISKAIAALSLATNFLVTAGFAKFNASISKFEVDASWTWISSNELSFHMIAFGLLFLVLASARGVGVGAVLVGLVSFIHLSKAHIVAALAAPLISVTRRRFWLLLLIVVAIAMFLRWVAFSEIAADLEVPDGVARVFNPLRDMLNLAGNMLLAGEFVNLAAVTDSVGLFRFEVYEEAVDLLPGAVVGYSQSVVDAALRGLDPHSNLVYLALREGWLTLTAYVLATIALIAKLPTATTRQRIIVAVFIYIFFRTFFLTYDPVKLLCLFIYATAVLRSEVGRAVSSRGRAR